MIKAGAIFFFFILFTEETYAQCSSKDSLGLNDILKNEIQLKPEVIEAIQSGNLINFDGRGFTDQSIRALRQYSLSKDFQQYINEPDSLTQKVDYTNMPPAVFWLYFNKPVEIVELQSFNLSGMENYVSNRPEPLVVTDPLMKGPASGGVRFMISISGVISYYFLKKR
jgi:hypothetical protein